MLMKNSHEKLIYTEPLPSVYQIIIKVTACGICRTDVHVVDGELKSPKLPLVPSHQIVGVIEASREEVHPDGYSKVLIATLTRIRHATGYKNTINLKFRPGIS